MARYGRTTVGSQFRLRAVGARWPSTPGVTRDVSSIAARTVARLLTMRGARKRTDGSDWLAINVRNIDDPELVAGLPIKMLDGASTWKVLGEHIQPDLFRSPIARSKKIVGDPKRSRASRRAV